jgi:hypothetical protein
VADEDGLAGGVVSGHRDEPRGLDTSVAHPARVWDYLLGGKDNFAADRDAAEKILDIMPIMGRIAQTNRAFLATAVHHLAADVGVRQFLDVGTGLPTANNTHEVAQRAAPDSRVVYVDNDPIVLTHARALLTSDPRGATAYIEADFRDSGKILREAALTLDFSKPVAVMLLAILHFVPDEDEPHTRTARLMEAMPPGSFLVISHSASDIEAPMVAEVSARYTERSAVTVTSRTKAEFTRFFDGLQIAGPGVVQLGRWQPGPASALSRHGMPAYCALGRKP